MRKLSNTEAELEKSVAYKKGREHRFKENSNMVVEKISK